MTSAPLALTVLPWAPATNALRAPLDFILQLLPRRPVLRAAPAASQKTLVACTRLGHFKEVLPRVHVFQVLPEAVRKLTAKVTPRRRVTTKIIKIFVLHIIGISSLTKWLCSLYFADCPAPFAVHFDSMPAFSDGSVTSPCYLVCFSCYSRKLQDSKTAEGGGANSCFFFFFCFYSCSAESPFPPALQPRSVLQALHGFSSPPDILPASLSTLQPPASGRVSSTQASTWQAHP